jgi:hypothetical protein
MVKKRKLNRRLNYPRQFLLWEYSYFSLNSFTPTLLFETFNLIDIMHQAQSNKICWLGFYYYTDTTVLQVAKIKKVKSLTHKEFTLDIGKIQYGFIYICEV